MYELYSADKRFGISISLCQLSTMLAYCRSQSAVETGGVLVGHYNSTLDMALLTEAMGPPADSQYGKTWFYRGTSGVQGRLNRMWEAQKQYYLGEWHYHPDAAPIPSGHDIKQMAAISHNRSYQCPEPVLVIVGGNPHADWTARGYVFPRGQKHLNLVPMLSNKCPS